MRSLFLHMTKEAGKKENSPCRFSFLHYKIDFSYFLHSRSLIHENIRALQIFGNFTTGGLEVGDNLAGIEKEIQ